MSGIENILKQIDTFGDEKCDEIISNANEQAQKIIDDANSTADSIYKTETEKSKLAVNNITESKISDAYSKSAREILNVKVTAVNSAINSAVDYLLKLNTEDYFDFLLKIFNAYKPSKNCTLHLSSNDLSRCPQSFKDAVKPYASVSDVPYSINGGFVLNFGETEDNCSFEALCEAENERIKDAVAKILF